jgi:DeoR/GlpR family transcriptional regulator of sugar metabolism
MLLSRYIIRFIRRNILMDNQTRGKILKLLGEKRVITSSELARFLGVSWNTAERYLMDLALDRKIIRIKKDGVNLWIIA